MTPLREILPEVMADLIEHARQAGHPPPPFVTERFKRHDRDTNDQHAPPR